MQQIDIAFDFILFFRIIVAAVCGGVIGYERQHHAKAAGFRTHIIIAVASALMMEVSKYGFYDVLTTGGIKLDPSRIAAGVAGAIGFLGAGIIFVHKGEITGLTTSAGMWATVGIGMTIGSGMYLIAIGTTVLIAVMQYFLHVRQEKRSIYARETCKVQIHLTEKNMDEIFAQLEQSEIQVVNIKATRNKSSKNEMEATLTMTYPKNMSFEELVALMNSLAHVRSLEITYRPTE